MSAHPHHSSITRRSARFAGFGLAVAALATSVVAVSAGSASADPDGGTIANAVVESGITLTDLTPAFTLTGIPGETVATGSTPVTYNVETNNAGGYTVTVQSATATMYPAVANGDTIPIANLTVRETGGGAYTPLTTIGGTAVVVHDQDVRSGNGGDLLSTDFQMRMPTVAAGTYSATLNYLAATPL